MQMLQFQIGQSFPLVLACFDNGTVALLKAREFAPIFEEPLHGYVAGTFYPDHFVLESCDIRNRENDGKRIELEYSTQYNYKGIPMLRDWLKQQNLQPPLF